MAFELRSTNTRYWFIRINKTSSSIFANIIFRRRTYVLKERNYISYQMFTSACICQMSIYTTHVITKLPVSQYIPLTPGGQLQIVALFLSREQVPPFRHKYLPSGEHLPTIFTIHYLIFNNAKYILNYPFENYWSNN